MRDIDSGLVEARSCKGMSFWVCKSASASVVLPVCLQANTISTFPLPLSLTDNGNEVSKPVVGSIIDK